MIRKLIALALLALVAAPLVSLHQLGGLGAKASVRIVQAGNGVSIEALVVATRL